jgi:hypothetical protein
MGNVLGGNLLIAPDPDNPGAGPGFSSGTRQWQLGEWRGVKVS